MKVMWGCIVLACLLVLLPLSGTRAASGLITLQEQDRGRTINLQVGQKLILNLRNPASGGYTANPPVFEAAVLRLESQEKLPPTPRKPPRMGDFGQLHYEWVAVAPGETEIVINIYRKWEKKPPQEFWRVKVRVQ